MIRLIDWLIDWMVDWLIDWLSHSYAFVCLFLFFFYLIRIDLYLSLRVHLLPGYPTNASGTLLVAFYVQQPAGLFIGNQSALPRSALVEIIQLHERRIEAAIGANITGVEALFKPTSAPTEIPVGTTSSSDETVWIVIGVLGGLVLLLLIILIVMFVHRR